MLTPSTVAYLFAPEWAPPPDSQWKIRAVGGDVDGLQTAASLLSIAVWSLHARGLIALEQLRALEPERGLVLGGRSFVRLTALDGDDRPPGIEGRLLDAARDRQRQSFGARLSRIGARAVDRLSGEDEYGLRGAVLGMDLHQRHPWATVADLCIEELREAELAKLDGGKVLINPAALEHDRERHEELVRERAERRARDPELDDAVFRDCHAAVRWAFSRE